MIVNVSSGDHRSYDYVGSRTQIADIVMYVYTFTDYLTSCKIKSDFDTTIQGHRVFAKSTDKQLLHGLSSTSCGQRSVGMQQVADSCQVKAIRGYRIMQVKQFPHQPWDL